MSVFGPLYLLHLTWVEANLKILGSRFLEGCLQDKGCRGLPRRLLATVGCFGSSRAKVQESVHSKVARRLREIQVTRENQVD